MTLSLAIYDVVDNNLHLCMEIALAFIVGNDSLFRTVERQALALCTRTDLSDIIETKHHILRRHSDRSTIGRVQDIMALEHQQLCFKDSLV